MKKALSIILALILAFTMALPAFAADNEIKLGEPKTVSVKDGKAVDVSFTPEEDGIYTYDCETADQDYDIPSVREDFMTYSYNNLVIIDQNTVFGTPGASYFIGEKGKTYTLTFYDDFDEDCEAIVTFNKVTSDGSLNDGKNSVTIKGDGAVFTFVPENSGYYNFASECDEDVAFAIIDDDSFEAYNDDNGFEDDYNFDCTAELEAGKTYLVGIAVSRTVEFNFGEVKIIPDETKCDVVITYGKTEKVEKIILGEWFGECLYEKDCWGMLDVSVAPSGALATADIKVTSSDESVVTIDEYNEKYGEIIFSTHNAGKAYITVTAGDVTAKYKVKVCNDFEWAFITLLENTFYSIRSIFREIGDIFLYNIDFFYRLIRGYYFR